MEEEKRHAMFAFPCREESKGGDRVFQLPQVDCLRPVEGLELFQKEYAHRKKRSRSLGATRTDEFVAEVKRKVNEDGSKSYAKLTAKMGCSKQPIANTINKDLAGLCFRPQVEGDPGVAVGEPPLPLEPGLVAPQLPDCNPLDYFFWDMVENKTNKHAHNTLDSLRAAIVEEFANMKKDVVNKACGRFRHRLEMVVAADGGYIKK
ncbi:Uncharacterized protein FKW44_006066 [Caligus rogercresseyi]|uniref:Uncharacterized protein n=1 Tax=Caligus rogercresseyi TaxID=217165 RepID=A0A7T8QSK8_CALRO|nr:Uncharacterized protein FKW44_006066 [Caligus rogercresseyi]